MSYVKDTIQAAIDNLSSTYEVGCFKLARYWETQRLLDDLDVKEMPLIELDNLTLSSNSTVQANFNYGLTHNFYLRAFDKFEKDCPDEDKEAIIDTLTQLLLAIHGEIYKLIVVKPGNSITFTLTPIPEIFAGNYTGVQMQMNIIEQKNILACE